MSLAQHLCEAITEATGERFSDATLHNLSGGCINEACCLDNGRRRYFVKLNGAERLGMFEAEAGALRIIAATETIRVPQPICCGRAGGKAYLVLEYITMGGCGSGAAMGKQLAELHRTTATRFGWERDNTIGSTPQLNGWEEDWIVFYRERRLRYQFELALRNGGAFSGWERLLERLPDYFGDYHPEPSLLHGDLWGGNASFDDEGHPVIFDPASYYGDRETDIAFTEMFGGFGGDFYVAYREAWPLHKGYAVRRELYNLYHLLNHFNLFGGDYQQSARQTLDGLLRA